MIYRAALVDIGDIAVFFLQRDYGLRERVYISTYFAVLSFFFFGYFYFLVDE